MGNPSRAILAMSAASASSVWKLEASTACDFGAKCGLQGKDLRREGGRGGY